jgi:hypothetical protein
MNVTGHLVFTPRSNTITGIPLAQAASTAGVRVAVVFGETMRALHPPETSCWMSLICLSSLASASSTVNFVISGCRVASACMVFQPTWRHGLSTEALEKQTSYGPGLAYLAVSTMVGLSACSHGLSAGPCGVSPRRASCRSYSPWSKNSDFAAGAELPPLPVGVVLAGKSLEHPVKINKPATLAAVHPRFMKTPIGEDLAFTSGEEPILCCLAAGVEPGGGTGFVGVWL